MPDELTAPVAPMTEELATILAEQAVERAGGSLMIYRNPRYAFSLQSVTTYQIEGHAVELRHGEISSPAVVTVGGYVFEILETGIELLIRPPKPRTATPIDPTTEHD